jgi:hypothetical protein
MIAPIITLANVVSFGQAVEARAFLGAEYHLPPRGPRRTFWEWIF